VKYRYLKKIILAVGFSIFSSNSFADDAAFIFTPAPANLSGDLNRNKVGLDVATVQINGAANVSASTFRYISKRGRNHLADHKKSLESVNYYITNMASDDFDGGLAFGFGFDGITGSASGSAFVFGTGIDLQSISRSTTNSSTSIMNLIMHLDLGAQHHVRVQPGISVVPWSKVSYLYSDSTRYTETQIPDNIGASKSYHDSRDVNASFAALSYGIDFLIHGYSIGAMYQQGENAAVTKISVSADF